MKNGANPTDKIRIQELHAEGFNAGEISEKLRIVLPCVKSFVDEDEDEDEIENTEDLLGK